MGSDLPDILFLSVDTMRRDCMAPYGENMMPVATELLEEGVSFDRCMATASWTGSSFGSMLSGLWPRQHGCLTNTPRYDSSQTVRSPLRPDIPLLPGLLQEAGYHTICSQGNTGFMGPGFGFAQGMDDYSLSHMDHTLGRLRRERIALSYGLSHDVLGRYLGYVAHRIIRGLGMMRIQGRPDFFCGETMVRQALGALKKVPRDRRVFLWVNFIDMHMPYDPPAKYLESVRPPGKLQSMHAWPTRAAGTVMGEEDRRYIRQRYEAGARYVNDCITQLLDAWPTVRDPHPRLTIFLSDHGEEFWDHGEGPLDDPTFAERGVDHGHTLYNELLHVPLVFHWPGTLSPLRKTQDLVSVIDLAPTLLDFLGMKDKSSEMGGLSLAEVATSEGHRLDERIAFADSMLVGPEQQAAVSAEYKLVRTVETGREQLFAWGADDPQEKNDLSDSPSHAEVKNSLGEALKHWDNSMSSEGPVEGFSDKEEAQLVQRLQDLGYL